MLHSYHRGHRQDFGKGQNTYVLNQDVEAPAPRSRAGSPHLVGRNCYHILDIRFRRQ